MVTPRLDNRSIRDIVEAASSLAQHYIPDWTGVHNEEDPGRRVIALFARLMELLIERENRIPEKNFVRFLDLVGIERFPGSPAEVPVTFLLARDAPAGEIVPVRTRVATTQTEAVDAQVFETTVEFFATSARIVEVVNLVPAAEGHAEVVLGELPPTAEWLADKSRAISALAPNAGGLKPVPHVLYLASQALFGRDERVDVTLVFTLASGDPEALSTAHVTWKRFDTETETWVPLDDVVDAVLGPSEVRIRLNGLAGIEKTTVDRVESHFIVGHLEGAAGLTLPEVTNVTGIPQTPGSAAPIAPDFAFANSNPLDLSKPFLPFGERPRYGDAFYLGSRTAFSPEVLTATFDFTILSYTDAVLASVFDGINAPYSIVTDVEWQYLRQDGTWQPIASFRHTLTANPGTPVTVTAASEILSGDTKVTLEAGSGTLFGDIVPIAGNTVRFSLELDSDVGLKTLNGEEAYWIRAILLSREPYGSDGFVIPGVQAVAPAATTPPRFVGPLYVPPTIETMSLAYTHRDNPIQVDRVITKNNFTFVDETETLADPVAPFRPFIPVQEHAAGIFATEPALYIGLDRNLDNAFASLFVHLDEPESQTTAPTESGDPRIVWEYLGPGALWRPIDVTDGTADLTTSGTVSFLAPSDPARGALFNLLLSEERRELDPSLFWLRARLASGMYDHPPRVLGVFLNTVMAENRSTVPGDVLIGSGNGQPRQIVTLVQSSILAGDLWVRELERPSEADLALLRNDILNTLRLDDLDAELDVDELVERREPAEAEAEIWVRWHRVPNFLSSGPRSRHYTLDRVRGVIGFGDGEKGLIAPIIKDNLVLRGFASGGGETANTAATPLAVKQLQTSLPFVDKVFNLTQATGGAAAWSLADTQQFGPQSIKNRSRAVTIEDYEWMIRDRFGQIAKVRCLPTRAPGVGGLVFQPGAVTAIVVPKSLERLPQPSNGLLRAIREFLQEKTLGNIVSDVHVIGPSFQPVAVEAMVKARSPQEGSLIARRVASALESWLHPLSGGDASTGWAFGRAVYLSEVFAVMARVPGVDHVQTASFIGAPDASSIAVGENSLTASGTHMIEVS